jgi:hypothetical protein
MRQQDLLFNHKRAQLARHITQAGETSALRQTPPRQTQPGEKLFEFLLGHDRIRCELRDHGPYGIEAQFYRNEEFRYGRRFDPRLDASRPSRELAIQRAEEERRTLEPSASRRRPKGIGRAVTAWRCLRYDLPVLTSYSRRKGDYAYDIQVHDVVRPVNADRGYYAVVVNLVRREASQTVSVNAGLHAIYGATPDEAVSRIEAVVDAWVDRQPRST